MTQKKNFDHIKQVFLGLGYQILSEKYVNIRFPIEYVCPKGHRGFITWDTFRGGGRCKKCYHERRAAQDRKDFNEIKDYITSQGYQILSNVYLNVKQKLSLICPEGHSCSINWSNFHAGVRCRVCSIKERGLTLRLDLDHIREYMKSEGYKLLSNKYRDNKLKLKTLCPQGHKYEVSWSDFKTGYRCAICAHKIRADKKRLSLTDVRKDIESNGYVLLSNRYIDSQKHLSVLCPKGHTYKVTWNNWHQGYRCSECVVYKGQQHLGKILAQIFLNTIKGQDNLDLLGRQTVDYSIRELKLAFEYDGEHHFKPTQYGGIDIKRAKANFKLQQERDARKNKLCQENGYKVIRIAYNEPLTLEYVKAKINKVLGDKQWINSNI